MGFVGRQLEVCLDSRARVNKRGAGCQIEITFTFFLFLSSTVDFITDLGLDFCFAVISCYVSCNF